MVFAIYCVYCRSRNKNEYHRNIFSLAIKFKIKPVNLLIAKQFEVVKLI